MGEQLKSGQAYPGIPTQESPLAKGRAYPTIKQPSPPPAAKAPEPATSPAPAPTETTPKPKNPPKAKGANAK